MVFMSINYPTLNKIVKPTIALLKDYSSKEAEECCDGMVKVLSPYYNIKMFGHAQCNASTFKNVDMVALPGGVGEADDYDGYFLRKSANAMADYVSNGGRYLGICIGAYWAGKHFFDILDGVDAVQYIKRPTADIRRSYNTVASVIWNNKPQKIFFRDGCAFVGDTKKFTTIASYANGDPMAIIQNRIGLMGACPDSLESWYSKPYLKPHWHEGRHHTLLLEFVNRLMTK